jgi:hypothetical protein
VISSNELSTVITSGALVLTGERDVSSPVTLETCIRVSVAIAAGLSATVSTAVSPTVAAI